MQEEEEEKHWRIDYWGVPSKQNIGCIIYTTNGILKGADDEHIIVFNRETAELIVKAVNDYTVVENIKKDGGEAYLNGFNDGASEQLTVRDKVIQECIDIIRDEGLSTANVLIALLDEKNEQHGEAND